MVGLLHLLRHIPLDPSSGIFCIVLPIRVSSKKKTMETIQDMIEEAKVRTVWLGLCIFSITYFLTHTSKSMWMNLPMAILILYGLRILSNQIEFRLNSPRQSQLAYLDKKQLSLNDAPPGWKKKIGSPVVEAAFNDFIDKILNDFVTDLWYSSITPDKEAPELIRGVIMDALGEISVRVKEINIVDLLTRDIFDLIGDHLEIFRRNHAAVGTDVWKTLSSEERDEKLKYHLMASGELYPALISAESEYKDLQKIVGGIFSVVLRPEESQCPLVRTIVREIVTCLVVQPLLNLASPERINEVIIINVIKEGVFEQFSGASLSAAVNQAKNMIFTKVNEQKTRSVDDSQPPTSSSSTGIPPEWMPPNVSVPILNLVDKVFQLSKGGWFRGLVYGTLKEGLPLVMECDYVHDWLLSKVCWLRNEDTVAHGIRRAQDHLWPNGVFFTSVGDGQEASDETDPSEKTFQMAGQLGGMKESSRRANEILNFLLDEAPTALVSFIGRKLYRRCARDIYYFTQSNVCIKQLAFAILELLLRTVFPELQDLLRDIRESSHNRSE